MADEDQPESPPVATLPFDPNDPEAVRAYFAGRTIDGVYVPRGEPGTEDYDRPPFVKTDADARRWDMAATVAATMFGDPRDPPAIGEVWHAARALYFSEVPTG